MKGRRESPKHRTHAFAMSAVILLAIASGCDDSRTADSSRDSPRVRPTPREGPKQNLRSDRRNNDGAKGIHGVLLDLYRHGVTDDPDVITVTELDSPMRPILTMTVNGAPIEFNDAGRRILRETYYEGFAVSEPNGTAYVMKPEELTRPSEYSDLYRRCRDGGLVYLMGFGKGLGVPERNHHELMLGPRLESSVLVEYLGNQSVPPPDFRGWNSSLNGKPLYRLWKLDPSTAEKSRTVAYLVDVVRKRIEMRGVVPKHFTLKKLFSVESDSGFPPFLYTLASGTYFEEGHKYEYRGELIDESGRPSPVGVFRKLEGGRAYYDLNVPR